MAEGSGYRGIDNGDRPEALCRAGSNPKLRRLAVNFKRGRGERKNRPGDLSDVEKALLDDLLAEVVTLRGLWERDGIEITG